jgi:hypothetical protein
LSAAFNKNRESQEMPQWLVDRLDQAGWIDAATAASRNTAARTCTGCRKPVLRGLTAFPMAISVDVDPWPLTAAAEAVCLLMGRATYELRHLHPHYDLDSRDQWRRKERPAGASPGVDVLAAHQCGVPPPLPWAATMLKEPPKPVHTFDDIPF